jgi:hypothetical protein
MYLPTYSSSFAGTENALREIPAGVSAIPAWLNGAADAVSWTNCQKGALSGGGNGAFGTQVPGGFDDSTAIINPAFQQFTPDQEVTIVIGSSGAPTAREVEIRLRSQLDLTPSPGGNNRGYEIDLLSSNQISLVVWLGALGGFAFLGGFNGSTFSGMDMADGTIWYASIIKTVITVKCTPISTGVTTTILTYDTANDDVIWTRGNPGIGFFANTGATASNTFGIKSFVANSLGDTTTPTIVQSSYTTQDGNVVDNISTTLTGVAPGSLILAHVGNDNTGNPSVAIDGFRIADGPRFDPPNNQSGYVFYRENAPQGAMPVKVKLSAAQSTVRLRVYEISGIALSNAFDSAVGRSQNTPGTGADAVSSGASAPTGNANDFVVGLSQNTAELDPGTGTITAGTGFTQAGPSKNIMTGERKLVTSTGQQTAIFTQSVNNNRVTHVVSFRAASAALAVVPGFPRWAARLGK